MFDNHPIVAELKMRNALITAWRSAIIKQMADREDLPEALAKLEEQQRDVQERLTAKIVELREQAGLAEPEPVVVQCKPMSFFTTIRQPQEEVHHG